MTTTVAAPLAPSDEQVPIEARSPLALFVARLREDKLALISAIVIVVLVAVAIFAPLIVKAVGATDPGFQDPTGTNEFGNPIGPSSAHIWGTDSLGRDVFSRVVYGARVSLEVALFATLLMVVLGVLVGLVAGYYRGWVDTALSRTMDLLLGFPIYLLAVGVGSACTFGGGCLGGVLEFDLFGVIPPGLSVVIFVIAFAQWPYIARIVRGQVLSIREREYIEASRSLGASDLRIMFREILPNLAATIIVYATLVIPQNILFEAALSFLGIGVREPTASWGAMIADAVPIFNIAWWFMLFPGLALVLTVFAFNLVGDGLQDALNPRTATSK